MRDKIFINCLGSYSNIACYACSDIENCIKVTLVIETINRTNIEDLPEYLVSNVDVIRKSAQLRYDILEFLEGVKCAHTGQH